MLTALAFQRSISDDPYVNGKISEPLLLFKNFNSLEVELFRPPVVKIEDSEIGCTLEACVSEPCGTDKDGSALFGDCPNTYGMMLFSDLAGERPFVHSHFL